MIPFYKPFVDKETEKAVIQALRSGWLSSGPLVREFEQAIKEYTCAQSVVCTGSAGMSLQMILRSLSVSSGDEVILPAYTHPATANAVVLCGATPVFADICEDDFCINPDSVRGLITNKTRAIIAVDIAGFPCDYKQLYEVAEEKKSFYEPASDRQKYYDRLPVIADASHSFGSEISDKKSGILADFTVFSFHAVKNLTTGEGGAICIRQSDSEICREFSSIFSACRVHGLSADALMKLEAKTWEHDLLHPSGKSVMTDLAASIGLCDIKRYHSLILPLRFRQFSFYNENFPDDERFICPVLNSSNRKGNGHLYIMRINKYSSGQRNRLMKILYKKGIATNLHFQPIPLFSWYQNAGFTVSSIPITMSVYQNCLSLPLYHDLSEEEQLTVCNTIRSAV